MSGLGFKRLARQVLSQPTQSAGMPPAGGGCCAKASGLAVMASMNSVAAMLFDFLILGLSDLLFRRSKAAFGRL
jgi:hypothetical protein